MSGPAHDPSLLVAYQSGLCRNNETARASACGEARYRKKYRRIVSGGVIP